MSKPSSRPWREPWRFELDQIYGDWRCAGVVYPESHGGAPLV